MGTIKKILLFFLGLPPLTVFSQKVNQQYMLEYLQSRYRSVLIKKDSSFAVIDSSFIYGAVGYYIDEKNYSAEKGLEKVKKIDTADVIKISYRPVPMGLKQVKPVIVIMTKSGQSKEQKKWEYKLVSDVAFINGRSKIRDSIYGSGNHALVLNDRVVRDEKARSTFFSLDYNEIAYIGENTGYQLPYYGVNSLNGVVFIWTKNKKK